jgi:hypothetical protein
MSNWSWKYTCWGDIEKKLNIYFFLKFKRDIYVRNYQTITKFELDKGIPMTYPYIKFELNVYNS